MDMIFRRLRTNSPAISCLPVLMLSFLLAACGGSDADPSNAAPTVSITPVKDWLRQGRIQTLTAQANDADGSISQIQWQQISGPDLGLTELDNLNLTFTPPLSNESDPINYSFRLTVTDNDNASTSADISFATHWSMNGFEASRLLHQATMGPTGNEISAAKGEIEIDWLENQMQLEQTLHTSLLLLQPEQEAEDRFSQSSRINAWWKASLNAEDQLRQRVTLALSEIFVVSDIGSDALIVQQEGLANYYDLLGQHAFGNFRTLLEAVTLSPIMGTYLSHLGNKKPNEALNIRPDENYAREVMQLFTIGLVQLNQDGTVKLDSDGNSIPTYGQDEITGFAHVFTGWTFANATSWTWPQDYLLPMVPWESQHATGEKTLLNGTVLPAGQSARQDLTQALDNLFNHPNVPPFISKQLIQRLVTSNPTPEYVKRVADVFSDNGQSVRGDLGAVIKAILLDDEARQSNDALDYIGKVREPLLRTVQFWRELNAASQSGWFRVWSRNSHGQVALGSPSVFNFFRPDYQPQELQSLSPQGLSLVAPELQIANDASLIAQFNHQYAYSVWNIKELVEEPSENQILVSLQPHVDLLTNQGLDALLDYYDLVFFSGDMSDAMRQSLTKTQEIFAGWSIYHQVGYMLFAISVSPEYIVQG